MKKQTLLAGFVFIFLMQSSLVLAINCDSISSANYESCMEILNSGIPENEKELLISNLEYKNQFFPDHDFIFGINSKIDSKSVPDGIEVYEKEFIKSAWVDIFALMPSVLYKNILYVPERISILTGFNYELEIPENYYSSGYPKTKSGDCKTKYYLIENEAENKVYVNNQYSGEGDLTDINIEDDSEIKVIYEINVRVKIRHYGWDRYCSSREDDGTCRRYSEKCDYDYTEIKNEELEISDKLNVKKYNNNLFAKLKPLISYGETTKLNINYSDSVIINFEDSEYSYHKFVYSIDYSKPPYYVNTLIAKDYRREKLVNLFREENNLVIKNTKDCKIFAFDFFNVLEKDCNSESQAFEFFIKTDKLKYNRGEEINVDIFPENISVQISYGDKIKTARGSAKFTADHYTNRIIAEYKGLRTEKIIYIIPRERLWIIWSLVVFVFLNYFLYIVLKKIHQKIK